MSDQSIPDFHFMAGHKLNFSEIVQAWLAFKDLRQRNSIGVSLLGEQIKSAMSAGWDLGFWPKGYNERYLDRMSAHPFDFFRGHEWGVDVYVGGRYVLAHRFHELAVKSRADSGLSTTFFSEGDVQRGVSLFRNALMEELKRSERRESGAPVAQAYQTSPFFFPSPLKAFLWEYGIANGEIYSRKSFGGLFTLRHDPSLEVERVADSHVEGGGVWGDVVFRSESGTEVRWKNVFRPKATLAAARRVLQIHPKDLPQQNAAMRVERSCPHCAEPILVQARLCKHCHQRLESGDSAA